MAKLFIEDLDVNNKRILMRVDFNVPLDNEGHVADVTRIEETLPSIRYILKNKGSIVLMSHLGRPQAQPNPAFSLRPVAQVLSSLLNQPVELAPNCIGESVRNKVEALRPGNILLLENLRFHRAEEHPEEDSGFAKELASFGDCYINDAFGTAHRKHSSTYTVAHYFPGRAAAGYLLEKEIKFLDQALKEPKRPFYALIGGAKISTKMGVIKSLLQKVDCLFVAGGMAYTFLKAKNFAIGNSLIEEDLVPRATQLLKEYADKIVLPVDCVAAKECSEDAAAKIFKIEEGIQPPFQGLDIGPDTIQLFKEHLKAAKTILWNGPFGVYEIDSFAKGTNAIAHFVAKLSALKIVGGGDLIAAIKQAGVEKDMSHISTGGGATLEYIEYGTLPGIEALSDKSTLPRGHAAKRLLC